MRHNNPRPDQQRVDDDDTIALFKPIVEKYQSLWKLFIRPERKLYPKDALGPERRRINHEVYYEREDKDLTNKRGQKIFYTYYTLKQIQSENSGISGFFKGIAEFAQKKQANRGSDTVLIYLHSHGGCRTEGMFLQNYCGEAGFDFCILDFSGSGYSEGQYTTLGIDESEDIEDLIQAIILTTKKKKFILWGRSMGAVASLMYTFKDPQYVEYLILDSPFSSIETMVRDVASSYIKLGEFLAMLVFKFICGSIKERIGYDLMELNPINYCSRMNTPIIFFVGKDDNLVLPERVKQMHDAYSGHKHLIVTNGSHESFRQPLELEEIFNRIQTFYGKEKKITSPKKVRGEDPKFIRENPILQQLNEFNINIPELEKNKTELLKMSNKIDLARGSDNKNFVDPFAQSSKKASNDPWSAETGGLSKLNTSSRSSQQFNVYDPSNYSNILETQEKGNEYHKYKNANLQIGKKVNQPLIGRPGISSSNKIEVATSLTTMVPISNEFDEFSGDNYYNEGLLTDPFPVKKNQPQSMMRKRHQETEENVQGNFRRLDIFSPTKEDVNAQERGIKPQSIFSPEIHPSQSQNYKPQIRSQFTSEQSSPQQNLQELRYKKDNNLDYHNASKKIREMEKLRGRDSKEPINYLATKLGRYDHHSDSVKDIAGFFSHEVKLEGNQRLDSRYGQQQLREDSLQKRQYIFGQSAQDNSSFQKIKAKDKLNQLSAHQEYHNEGRAHSKQKNQYTKVNAGHKNLQIPSFERSVQEKSDSRKYNLNSSMISGRNQNQEAGVRQVIDNNERQEKSRVKRKIFEDDDDEHLENVYRAKTDLNSSQLQNQLCSQHTNNLSNKHPSSQLRSDSQQQAYLRSHKESFHSASVFNQNFQSSIEIEKLPDKHSHPQNANKRDKSVNSRQLNNDSQLNHFKSRSIVNQGDFSQFQRAQKLYGTQQAGEAVSQNNMVYLTDNVAGMRLDHPRTHTNSEFHNSKQDSAKTRNQYDPAHIERNIQPTFNNFISKISQQAGVRNLPSQNQGSYAGSLNFNQKYENPRENFSGQHQPIQDPFSNPSSHQNSLQRQYYFRR